MKLLLTSEYKNLTDQELDLLIAETEEYIKDLKNLYKTAENLNQLIHDTEKELKDFDKDHEIQNEFHFMNFSTQMMELKTINVFRFENDNIDYKKEIINYEEKLLKIDDKYKYSLTFNEAVRLKRYMKKVGDITNVYFELIEDYHKSLRIEGATSDIVNDMYSYNDTLQASEVDSDLINMNEVIGFINIISEKYNITFSDETDENIESFEN